MSCYRSIYYYPFGMQMQGPWELSVSSPENKYLYNGIEHASDFGLDWDMAMFRSYDSAIGRWLQVDPLAEFATSLTPYRFGFNNPILFGDPAGLFETKKAAKEYAKANGIKTGWFRSNKINKEKDGTYAIENKKAGTSTSDLGEKLGGVMTSILIQERGMHLREVGYDKIRALSDPSSDSYNPNAVLYNDWGDTAYAWGLPMSVAAPTGRLASVSQAAKASNYLDDIFNIGKFSEEIIAINRSTKGGGAIINGHPSSVLASAGRYSNVSDQAGAIMRGINELPRGRAPEYHSPQRLCS